MNQKLATYTAPCATEGCGNVLESRNLAGLAVMKFCNPCRDRGLRELQEDAARRQAASQEYQRKEYIRDSTRGIPRRFWESDWRDFEFDRGGEGNRVRVRALYEYAKNFPVDTMPHGHPSVLLASPMNGVGKTMLASLVLKTILERYEEMGRNRSPFQFWASSRVKMRLRSAQRFDSPETMEQVYAELTNIPLLILDDVGKEQLEGGDAGFTYEMYWNLIDNRYNRELPVVLTSNLDFHPWEQDEPCLVDLMGRAAVSRLAEMTNDHVYIIEGEDRR